jgi:hypothetical protein
MLTSTSGNGVHSPGPRPGLPRLLSNRIDRESGLLWGEFFLYRIPGDFGTEKK